MKLNRKLSYTLLLAIAALFTQCKDSGENLTPDDENELITSVILHFKEAVSGTTTTFSFKDSDGDGGNPASKFDTISLKANASYTLTVEFLDESKSPVVDITKDIEEEQEDHLVIFTPSPASLLTYTYGDKDKNNFVIGLLGTAKAGAAGTGKLKVQLRHQPGVKNGTAAPGSDDVQLDFNLKVN